MSDRTALLVFLAMVTSPILLGIVGATACDDPSEEAVDSADDGFEGCAGFERPYTEAWLMCMDKMGNGGGLALERCQGFARALICHPPMKLPPCKCAQEKAALKRCEAQRQECTGALADQQELRFWKRCGVVRPGDYDQWANCNGNEAAAEAFCNPKYGPVGELCTEETAEHFERMKQDGVSWIDCKEGEVCP